MTLGHLAGVKIKISPLFFILFIIGAINAGILLVTVYFILVLAHEIGHIVMAHYLNLNVYEIELLPLGGRVRIASGNEMDPINEIKLAMAGPIVNILLLAFGILLNSIIEVNIQNFATIFVQGNVVLIFFNLLPILPLDGGRVYRSLLVQQKGFIKATKYMLIISSITILFILSLSVLGIFYGLDSWYLLLIAIFLSANFIREYRVYRLHFIKHYLSKEVPNKKVWQTNTLTVHSNMTAKDVIKQFIPGKYNIVILINTNGEVIGRLTEKQVIRAIHNEGPFVKLKNIHIFK